MEDKKTAFAILICIIIFLSYQTLVIEPTTRSTELTMLRERLATCEKARTEQSGVATGAAIPCTPSNTTTPTWDAAKNQVVPAGTGNESLTTKPTLAAINQAPVTTVESSVLIARFTHLGARLRSYELKNYRRELGKPDFYEMVSQAPDGNFPLPLGVIVGGVDDASVPYTLAGVSGGEITASGNYTVPQDGSLTLRFEGVLPNGIAISKSVEFLPESYLFNVSIKLGEASPDGSNVWLAWSHLQPNLENIPSWDFVGFHTLVDGKLGHFAAKDAPEGIQELGQTKWVSYADKYFMSALMPTDEVNTAARSKRESAIFQGLLAGNPTGGTFQVFSGPKDYPLLKGLGHELHRNVDLGYFSFLAHPLLVMLRFFDSIFNNWGLAIILLTLLIKFAFLPLTRKSFTSMAAMQELQPEITALRARLKDDPTRMNQEMMALYKKNKVNPVGGCFPILIQIPVFLGLYNALNYSIELRHAPFALWIKDLSAPELFYVGSFGIPVMVILMGISMFIQQWTTPSTMDPMQKKIMMVMPVIFTFMFIGFPAGLVLYWLTNNVISIVQQHYIRKASIRLATQATILSSLLFFGFAFALTLLKY